MKNPVRSSTAPLCPHSEKYFFFDAFLGVYVKHVVFVSFLSRYNKHVKWNDGFLVNLNSIKIYIVLEIVFAMAKKKEGRLVRDKFSEWRIFTVSRATSVSLFSWFMPAMQHCVCVAYSPDLTTSFRDREKSGNLLLRPSCVWFSVICDLTHDGDDDGGRKKKKKKYYACPTWHWGMLSDWDAILTGLRAEILVAPIIAVPFFFFSSTSVWFIMSRWYSRRKQTAVRIC